MLSSHAFNALLKTLEEPPPHVKFIFATTDPHKVLATVAVALPALRLPPHRARARSRPSCGASSRGEGVALPDEALRADRARGRGQHARRAVAARAGARGRRGRARRGDGARAARRGRSRARRRPWPTRCSPATPPRCLRQLATLYEHGYDPQRFCRDLLEHFRHLAVAGARPATRTLLAELPEAERDGARRRRRSRRSADELQRVFRLLLEADETLASPVRTIDPQLVLEMARAAAGDAAAAAAGRRDPARASTPSPAPAPAGLGAAARRRAARPPPPPPARERARARPPARAERRCGSACSRACGRSACRSTCARRGAPARRQRRRAAARHGQRGAAARGVAQGHARRGSAALASEIAGRAVAGRGRSGAGRPRRRDADRAGAAARRRRRWPTRWCRRRSRSSAPRCAGCATGGPVRRTAHEQGVRPRRPAEAGEAAAGAAQRRCRTRSRRGPSRAAPAAAW